jgi:hypothetical protein
MAMCGFRCNPGFGNCDGNAENGCETNLDTSSSHCGTCGNACPARPNATATCSMGECGFTCNPGYADCDSNPANGCEVNLNESPSHCGRCGNACPARPNATATCHMAMCRLTCNRGFGNCDGDPTNGCEANLNESPSHCGRCGNACPMGQVCNGGRCQH